MDTPAAAVLSDPAQKIVLPFPNLFEQLPTFRFHLNNGNWKYMGREKFKELLKKVEEHKQNPHVGLWLYGTIGYGKSHLLAALVCHLVSRGDTVVYVPDCPILVRHPVRYLRMAMLLAWGNDSEVQEEIVALETMEETLKFFHQVPTKAISVVDQMNALEDSHTDDVSDKIKQGVGAWLRACSYRHKTIYSSLANCTTFLRMHQKQTNIIRVDVRGGLTAVRPYSLDLPILVLTVLQAEVEEWWKEHPDIDLDGYTREEVEDITGSIPLLLDSCIEEGKINLSAEALVNVSNQIIEFMRNIKRNSSPKNFEWYTQIFPIDHDTTACLSRHFECLAKCIACQPVFLGCGDGLVDHRYFYQESNSKGNYTCGIARETAARMLRQFQMNDFGDANFLQALDHYIDNPSVTGFFIGQAVLSCISNCGLDLSKELRRPITTVMFLWRLSNL